MKLIAVVVAACVFFVAYCNVHEKTEEMKNAFKKALCGDDQAAVLACMEHLPEEYKETSMKVTGSSSINEALVKLCADDELHGKVDEELSKIEMPDEKMEKAQECMKPIYQKYGVL